MEACVQSGPWLTLRARCMALHRCLYIQRLVRIQRLKNILSSFAETHHTCEDLATVEFIVNQTEMPIVVCEEAHIENVRSGGSH